MEKAEQSSFVAALKAQLDAFRARSDGRLQRLSGAVMAARSRLESQVGSEAPGREWVCHSEGPFLAPPSITPSPLHLLLCLPPQLQLATRILLLAERCREFESAGERVVPVPQPDVAVGPTEGTVVAGPAASTRTAIGLLLSHPASSASSSRDATSTAAAGGGEGEPPAPSPTLVAATVALTSGALVPVGLTAARHGLVPRADGLLGDAAVAAGAAMRDQAQASRAAVAAGGEAGRRGGGAEEAIATGVWDIVTPGPASPGGRAVTAEAPRATVAWRELLQQQHSSSSDAALEETAREQTAAARLASSSPPAALPLLPDGSRLLAEVADSSEMDSLDLFWRRYSRALLDALVLERQKAALVEENAGLQVRWMMGRAAGGARGGERGAAGACVRGPTDHGEGQVPATASSPLPPILRRPLRGCLQACLSPTRRSARPAATPSSSSTTAPASSSRRASHSTGRRRAPCLQWRQQGRCCACRRRSSRGGQRRS